MPEPDNTELNAEITKGVAETAESLDTSANPDATVVPAAPAVADEVLLAAVDVAREALLEITSADSIGEPAGHIVEGDHALSLLFENRLDGYPGWLWTVSLARVEDGEPTILETELMPGDGALLAPDWVPWSERLAEYRAQQQEAAREAAESDDEDDEDEDDDESENSLLHAGDLDGVDVDELDDSDHDDSDDDDSDEDSDEDSDDDDSDEH
ncbi:Protein of unknown function [Paramicrobacterium humi]|uniref:DUF3027 domain-containing protein n=1 Tax=Paramicrobacterium humi TaxID=640635 RepID=A0A1H4NTN2_9MICO|nr:DUF3027 domain-containing protein [Microbacterium humi]SEB98591.1 Protein of unknown function [Microbacterium humi]